MPRGPIDCLVIIFLSMRKAIADAWILQFRHSWLNSEFKHAERFSETSFAFSLLNDPFPAWARPHPTPPFPRLIQNISPTMNNRPVEQALSTLVPTHANDLPQELLSYAMSLVAQSRSFSSSLKPEEEIARPYACAEIACRRYATDPE
jgi:hypothetical protein